MCKIEKIGFFGKIDRNFASTNAIARRLHIFNLTIAGRGKILGLQTQMWCNFKNLDAKIVIKRGFYTPNTNTFRGQC